MHRATKRNFTSNISSDGMFFVSKYDSETYPIITFQ